jgi:hypothetical protein
VAQLLGQMELDGETVPDEALVDWLENGAGMMTLLQSGQRLPVTRIDSTAMPAQFGYMQQPRP